MKRILLIEDEPDHVQMVTMRLEGSGYKVASAPNGEEGIGMVNEFGPDLILLDVVMPKMNGLEVCRALKADPRTKNIPIVIFTASGQRDIEQRCLEAGAAGFIQKPYDSKELLDKLKKYIGD